MSRQPKAIEDILPLSPLQEGLLFHSVYDRSGDDVYTAQSVFELTDHGGAAPSTRTPCARPSRGC